MSPDNGQTKRLASKFRVVWTAFKVVNARLRFVLLMVVVGLIAGNWDRILNHYERWTRPAQAVAAEEADVEFFCPMHPNIIRDTMGTCPICGMPLPKRARTEGKPLPEGVLAQVKLSPQKVAIGRIATSPVEYRLLSRELRTVGVVDYDETRRAFIAARIKGRIEKLMVNYVGQRVEKGAALALIYSPDLLVAQEELLTAVRTQRQQGGNGLEGSAAQALVDASRRKLLLWGITEAQIDAIIERGRPETNLTIYSPISGIVTEKKVLEGNYVNEGDNLYTIADLSRVWMQAQIFENDIAGVKEGTAVAVTSVAHPDKLFAGRVTFVSYTVDSATRTLAARVEIDNPEYQLKPGMYVTANIRLPAGEVKLMTASASQPAAAAITDGLVKPYLAMAAAYAADRTDEAAAGEFLKAAQALASQPPLAAAAGSIAAKAKALRGKKLQEQRKLFKTISEETISLLRKSPASETLYIVHCPMYPGSWLSRERRVSNPYHGSEMPRCGAIKGSTAPTAAKAETERFVIGYYCPLYPDRVFEKPEHCVVDGFPTKLARLEKVLAVPESAVVDTGTRRVVYREAGEGVFEMVAVKLGTRAGEFYPVLEGLKPGEKVATAGAFVIDAENRLNPGAAAQYFGASGGPSSGSNHQH